MKRARTGPGETRDGSDGSLIAAYHKQLLAGEVTCEDRVREELENIESYCKDYNAFITIFGGKDGLALSRARVLDRRLAERGDAPLSPLFGVPITIKDNTFLGGFPTTNASAAFADFTPTSNATIVDQLLDAGCIPLGKTNLHELAIGVMGTSGYQGPIHNPIDPKRISGGSSGGSAVSVALSKGALLSTGSDTGGSVRVPAALCGICGFKPSKEVLSTNGLFPLSGSLDHSGLFAKNMPDLAIGFRAITGSEPNPRPKYRIGIPSSYFVDGMDERVSKDFWSAIDALKESERFEVTQVRNDADRDDYRRYARARVVITLKEGSWFYESILRSERTRRLIHGDVLALLDSGLKMGMMRYMDAMNQRAEAIRSVSRLLKGLDILAMPTSAIVPPKIDEVLGNETGNLRPLLLRNTELFNLTGLPALSFPTHRQRGSLPTGVQFVGAMYQDERVLGASEAAWGALRGASSNQ